MAAAVYLGSHSVLSPSGFLPETMADYSSARSPLKLANWKSSKIEIRRPIGVIPDRCRGIKLGSAEFPPGADYQIRLQTNLGAIVDDFARQTGPSEFDAFIIGRSRLRSLRLDKTGPQLRGWPPQDLADWVVERLAANGIIVPHGRVVSLEAACTTGIAALRAAHRRIRSGQFRRVLLLSFDIVTQDFVVILDSVGVLTPREKPLVFHEKRDGFARSEAISLMALTDRPEPNVAPVVVQSVALSSDAGGFTEMDAQGVGIMTCLKECLSEAGIDVPSFIKAHGTGTRMNDRIEAAVLSGLFIGAKNPIPMVALKSQFGHTMNGSALFEMILACQMLRNDTLMPVMNSSAAFDSASLFVPREPLTNTGLRTCLGLAMGFGGLNGAYCLEKIA